MKKNPEAAFTFLGLDDSSGNLPYLPRWKRRERCLSGCGHSYGQACPVLALIKKALPERSG